MVDTSIQVSKLNVRNKTTETITTAPGNLTTFEGFDAEQVGNVIDPVGSPIDLEYDISINTSGAALGITPALHYRTVEKPINSAVQIASFFTGVRIGTDDVFRIKSRENKNGVVSYDLFIAWENVLGTLTNLDLKLEEVSVPPGGTIAALLAVANATDPVHFRAVFRETRGVNRIYDVFTLSQP